MKVHRITAPKPAGVRVDADALLAPELREQCRGLSAREREKLARKYQKWVNQLTESAIALDPDTVPLVPRPKVPRGFFLVNMSRDQREEWKAILRRRPGVYLPMVLQWAIHRTIMRMREQAALMDLTGVQSCNCYKFLSDNPRN